MSVVRSFFTSLFLVLLSSGIASAKPLPDPMLSNLFALTDVAASLSICANSSEFTSLSKGDQKSVHQLNRHIDKLVAKIAQSFDPSLTKFYIDQRIELTQDANKLAEMKQRYGNCGNGLIPQLRRYVYTSKKTLDEFFKAYNR
ncbi:MAG: hypothetical protein JKY20_00625 [Alphaproteobacteria bacterium]|nr:hypothetical protein [Alphaproteobacteria bacterium]